MGLLFASLVRSFVAAAPRGRASLAHALAAGLALALLAGCATRPVNPPLAQVDRASGYRMASTPGAAQSRDDTFMVLAFSGGGTRAAAFAYGVLEELRSTLVTIDGKPSRLLDRVDVITGVSGGSFTALSYGLYGEELFDVYEQRFLKRNVQGELIARFFSPVNWASLWSNGYGRSELAAQLYDDVLFDGATFADLARRPGPFIIVTATDISTGSRLGFVQGEFDVICSDLSAVHLARAAAASSAVPLVMSPVTINNYAGRCGYREPEWMTAMRDVAHASRPAGRALARIKELESFQDSVHRPYLHLVDGGLSDNLGMRAVLEAMESIEASAAYRRSRRIDALKRIVVVVVNSLSVPKTNWDESERPPNDLMILLKATGVPIDRYSYEAVELLKDIVARWQTIRRLRHEGVLANGADKALASAADVPDIELFAINVSFDELPPGAERDYLNDLPTSFALSGEQVDRLRAAAGSILRASPEYQRLLRALGTARSTAGAPPAH
jgi:NTE family protein